MAAVSSAVDLSIEQGVAIITVDNPPVNALSPDVRRGMHTAFKVALGNDAVEAVLLICAGRMFIAGADITEFGTITDCPSHHEILDLIENSTKPVVAAIHGTALGGGLETALVCHYRVAVADARFGLPEVKLGLTPGSGGTQRLPRVVGVPKALEMVTTGAQIGAAEALETGLVDAIVGELRNEGIAFACAAVGKPLVRIRDRDEKISTARAHPELFTEARKAIAHKWRGFEAPEANIRCIEAAVNSTSFDEGMKAELDIFCQLVASEQSAAQRYFFFAERAASRIPDVPADTPEIPIASVGIIGAGTMGGGIAMAALNADIPVTLVETRQDALDRGIALIRKNYENTARKGRMSEADIEARMSLLRGTLALEDLSDVDLVIEAAYENMAIKQDIFSRLDGIAKEGAILASNTSGLDINAMAAMTRRPENVIGLHFFSPANVMKLLEVVRAAKTSKPVIKTCMAFARRIGKVAVLVGVCPGFVGNRILFPRQIQADHLMMEGALPRQIDKVLYDFGMPMGPYQMSDLAGLDIGWSAETSRGETIYERLCEAGRFGQKNRKGFYDYDENRRPTPSAEVEQIILEMSAARGIKRRAISDEEILERCLFPMINEGAKVLEEGIAIRASDIDVIWVYGYGWPIYRGGPMYHADTLGLDRIAQRMQSYYDETGDLAWKPAALLLRLAEDGKGFQDFA